MSDEGATPTVVAARGLRCPLPVIMLARAARELPGGTRVRVLSTDPAARLDVPAWARMRGHTLVPDDGTAIAELPAGPTTDAVVVITVRLGGDG